VLTTAALLSGSSCHGGAAVVAVSTTGVSPGRFHNAVRVEHASQNLADALAQKCGAQPITVRIPGYSETFWDISS
jgi:hypothetical protein